MASVITFSRTFPSYHPKAGQSTYFVEKILNQLKVNYTSFRYLQKLLVWNKANLENGKLTFEDIESFYLSLQNTDGTKSHTIRGGIIQSKPKKLKKPRVYKVGQKFSPRVWFGVPYNSPQIIFFDEIEVKKVWDIKVNIGEDHCSILISDYYIDREQGLILAKNDGLKEHDLYMWFNKSIKGQIICWDENVNY